MAVGVRMLIRKVFMATAATAPVVPMVEATLLSLKTPRQRRRPLAVAAGMR